ncbi:MAG: hypothetical protein ACI8RZ_006615 [Myxococcota bacterium]|jgi:hypothetical protein
MSGDLPQHMPVQLLQRPRRVGAVEHQSVLHQAGDLAEADRRALRQRAGRPQRAPMGKVPYVSISGSLQGDSQLIIEHLTETRGIPIDAALTPRVFAVSSAPGLHRIGMRRPLSGR